MKRTIINLALIFIIVVILGFTLIVAVYTVPTDHAYASIVEDGDQFTKFYPSVIPGYKTSRLDRYTDSKILSEIAFYNQNRTLLENSMIVYGTVGKNFTKFVNNDNYTMGDYPRYWHGDLVMYKPLFTFLDYDAVKILELAFQLVMIVVIIRLMFENSLKNYVFPFILSLVLINFEVIGLCLQFSNPFNVTLVSTYLLIRFKDYLFERNRLLYFFMIVGMVTNYVDLLTFPLISFGMPMIFYILLQKDNASLKENIMNVFLFGAVWLLGYAGMWFSKWLISSVLLHKNIIANGVSAFLNRSSSGADITRLGAVLKNVTIYRKKAYLIIFVLIFIYYVKRFITERKNISKDNIKQVIPLILIALIPFVWFYLASNHSYIHYWFTFRILFIFFFALMCGLEFVISKRGTVNRE